MKLWFSIPQSVVVGGGVGVVGGGSVAGAEIDGAIGAVGTAAASVNEFGAVEIAVRSKEYALPDY